MHCLICNSATRPLHHPTLLKTYFHCSHCDFIFLDPNQRVDRAKEQHQYNQHNNTLENEGYVAMFERFLSPLALQGDEKILDFGSGPTPVLSQLLTQKGYSVEIYDPIFSPTLPVSKMSFDVITSTEVIEHIFDPLQAFTYFVEFIKEGGSVAIQTQFHPQDDATFFTWWYPRDPTHIGFYQAKTFEVLAELFHFNIIYNDTKSIIILKKL